MAVFYSDRRAILRTLISPAWLLGFLLVETIIAEDRSSSKAVTPPLQAMASVKPQQHSTAIESKLVYTPNPFYPHQANKKGVTGSGRFEISFDERGRTKTVTVTKSTGSRSLDSNTVNVLKQWRANPGKASKITIAITYTTPKTREPQSQLGPRPKPVRYFRWPELGNRPPR